MENLSISVVIPVKNDAAGLHRCLASLLEMERQDLLREVIVVDNGSVDGTVQIARSHGVKVLEEPHLTVAGLRNVGVAAATGDVVAFIDSDCVAQQEWLVNALRHFHDPSVGCVGAMAKCLERTKIERAWNQFRTRRTGVRQVAWINSMNMFVLRRAFAEVGGFNASLRTCEDVDLCYRIGEKFQVISDDTIVVYHHGEATNLAQFFRKEMWRGYSNFDGVYSHGWKRSELKSVALPVYCIASALSILVTSLAPSLRHLVVPTILVHLLPYLLFFICQLKTAKGLVLCQTYLLYFYALARSFGLLHRMATPVLSTLRAAKA